MSKQPICKIPDCHSHTTVEVWLSSATVNGAAESALRPLAARGQEIWARQAGSGEEVLLISGLGDDHRVWAEAFHLLADGYRVTAFDNRGVGRSPLGTEPFSMARMAEDALGVMELLEIDAAHVVGSSMGGAIAQELALAAPERIQTLSLVGSWARRDEHLSRLLRHFCELLVMAEDPRGTLETFALWVYSGRAHADGAVDCLLDDALAYVGPEQSPEAFARTAEVAIAHDPGEQLGGIAVPTLILVGGEDRICPKRLSEELAELIVGSRLEVLPGRGHQPFQEAGAEFAAALTRFWNDSRR